MLKAFRKLYTSDKDLDAVQQAVGAVLNPVIKLPIMQGRLVTSLLVGTTATNFEHGLGRTPLGYMITDIDRDAVIFRTEWDARFIKLTSSAATTTFSIWIF